MSDFFSSDFFATDPMPPDPGSTGPDGTADSAQDQTGGIPPSSTPEFPVGSAQKLLSSLVEELAKRFKADRCTLFLYNETDCTYTLRAAYGYPMFGRATIIGKIGEGITGRVLAERRPIYTETAAFMRGYISRPNFPDADVQTFLGIPLLRGRERIGAIVFRRRTNTPFLADEISAIRTHIAEITSSIQNAGALLVAEMHGEAQNLAAKSQLPDNQQIVIRGTAVSNGWAMGPALFFKSPTLLQTTGQNGENHPPLPNAIRSLDEAIAIVEEQLKASASALERRLPEAVSMLLEAGLMMLHDESYTGRIRTLAEKGMPIPEAIVKVSNEFISIFKASDSEYIREKVSDVEDLAVHLLEAITSQSVPQSADRSRANSILITEKLLPSDVLRIARDGVAGIILCAGGTTAHVTLLVRSLRIPMVIVETTKLLSLPDNRQIILDCANENIYVNPEPSVVQRFAWRRGEEDHESAITPKTHGRNKTYTRDGERIILLANINILADLDTAENVCAEGVGLYRTEFPFLMRQSLPSIAEQYAIYERILRRMDGKPVTFRTLDAGGDKMIPYLFKVKEDNPALGLRSIRFSLKFPYILDQQLHAILQAVQDTGRDDVSIMFPMISSVEEFRAAREHVVTCLSDIHSKLGDKPIHEPFIGTMIEVPAALGVLDALAEESDFFSIGTNDLIQYILAADRTNSAVTGSYIPHHPAVLRALKTIADTAIEHDTPLCICGEMGRDPKYLPFLIGIGIRQFSLESAQITKTQELISRLTIEQCKTYADELLSKTLLSDIEAVISDFARKTFG